MIVLDKYADMICLYIPLNLIIICTFWAIFNFLPKEIYWSNFCNTVDQKLFMVKINTYAKINTPASL